MIFHSAGVRATSFLLMILFWQACEQKRSAPSMPVPLSDTENATLKKLLDAANIAAGEENYTTSDSMLRLCDPLLEKNGRSKTAYLAHRRQALNLFAEDQKQASVAYIDSLVQRFGVEEDSISGMYYGLQGWLYFHTNNYQGAIAPLERAAVLFEQCGLNSKLNGIYNNLGASYGQLGDHEKAMLNYQAALTLNEKKADTAEIDLNLRNLSQAYFNLGDLQNAEQYNHRRKNLGLPDDGTSALQEAEIALAKGQAAAALRMIRQLKTQKPDLFDGSQNDQSADNLLTYGTVLHDAGHLDEAIICLKKSLAFFPANPVAADWQRTKNCHLLGDSFLKKGNPDTALTYFQQAIEASAPTFHSQHVLDNPTADALPTEVWAMEALYGKASALDLMARKNSRETTIRYTRAALESSVCAIQIIQNLKNRFVEDDSRLWLGEYAFQNFYGKPLALAIRLYELTGDHAALEKAYHFAAQSKAGVLRTALAEKQQLYQAGVGQDAIRQLRDMRLTAASLQSRLNDAPSDSLRTALFQVKREIDNFRKNLHLPNIPTDTSTFSIAHLQQQLADGALLVEYFFGDQVLYIFSMTKNSFDVDQKILPPDFDEIAANYHRSVSDWAWINDTSALAEKTYLQSAARLYDFLLKNTLEKHPDTRRLFIVPDKSLARLPFAALLTRPFSGSWQDVDLPVLIKKMAVSYRFSSDISTDTENPAKVPPKYGFGGFGANYKDGLTLTSLKKSNEPAARNILLALRGGPDSLNFADNEVDSISHLTGGKKWLNEQATKSNFLQNAADCRILHFSLHTIQTDPHDPTGLAILFSKTTETDANILTSGELYALNLNSEMAVVSSCESGFGQFRLGEGTLSLGRAMALAGCHATVINLWKADDRSSRDQMIAFYKNLKAGQPKDIALQNTLIAYLNNTVSERAGPQFWANFSAVGDMRPLVFASEPTFNGYLWAVTLCLLLVVVVVAMWRRRLRQ